MKSTVVCNGFSNIVRREDISGPRTKRTIIEICHKSPLKIIAILTKIFPAKIQPCLWLLWYNIIYLCSYVCCIFRKIRLALHSNGHSYCLYHA